MEIKLNESVSLVLNLPTSVVAREPPIVTIEKRLKRKYTRRNKGNKKYSDMLVRKIERRLKKGLSSKEISRELKLHSKQVIDLVRTRLHKNISWYYKNYKEKW